MAENQVQSAIGFDAATRLKRIMLPAQAKTVSAQLLSWQLPRVGFLRAIMLPLRLTIAGTLSAPNALGQAVIVSQVRLVANSGFDVWNISGVGYHYLLRELFELGQDVGSYTTGRSAVAAGASVLDMYLPVAPNQRDPVGLLNLQTEESTYTLSVQFAVDTVAATGVTGITGTVTPMLEIFTVPADEINYPPDDVVMRVLEDTMTVAQTTEYTYNPARGDVLLQMAHGYGIGVSGTDQFSAARLRVNQSENVVEWQPQHMDMVKTVDAVGVTRRLGTITYDLVSSSGLGNYDKYRDAIDTGRLTDISSLFTPTTQPVTLYTVRRSLARIG